MVLDTWDFSFNGTVVSAQRFINALKKQSFDFTIFALGEEQENKVCFNKVFLPGCNKAMQQMKSPLAMPQKQKVYDALKDCDLLHVQYPFFLGTSAINSAKKLGIPVVCSFHVQPENMLQNIHIKPYPLFISMFYKLFMTQLYNRADIIIAPSPFAERLLKKHGLKTPVKVISNGVPESFLQLGRDKQSQISSEENKEISKKQKLFTILSVGRLGLEKNQAMIIKALTSSKHANNIELILVGAGPQEEPLKKLAKGLPFKTTVKQVSSEELHYLYSTVDLFVHASEIELEGMSVLEAMASGLPVVVADAKESAARDFPEHEQSLFAIPNINDLTSKIDYWLDHPEARKQACTQNYQIASQFSHQESANTLSTLYNKLIASTVNTTEIDIVDA